MISSTDSRTCQLDTLRSSRHCCETVWQTWCLCRFTDEVPSDIESSTQYPGRYPLFTLCPQVANLAALLPKFWLATSRNPSSARQLKREKQTEIRVGEGHLYSCDVSMPQWEKRIVYARMCSRFFVFDTSTGRTTRKPAVTGPARRIQTASNLHPFPFLAFGPPFLPATSFYITYLLLFARKSTSA